MGNANPIAKAEETSQHMAVLIKQKSSRYFDDLLKSTCGPDLLALSLFPNAKEITESFALYHAYHKFLRKTVSDQTQVVVIGDGSTPRTAALFAFKTKHVCSSIDPGLREDTNWDGIDNLYTYKMPLRGYCFPRGIPSHTIIILPHSHVPHAELTSFLKMLRRWDCISMACCVENEGVFQSSPDIEYADWGVWSPHRMIKIWRGKCGI